MRRAPLFLLLASCTQTTIDLSGLACDTDADCLDGFECHPQTGECVHSYAWDCQGDPGSCPSAIERGNPCEHPGSFVPCVDDVTDCSAGCRTCQEDGTWGLCVFGNGADGEPRGDAAAGDPAGGDPAPGDAPPGDAGDPGAGDPGVGDPGAGDPGGCTPTATRSCTSPFGGPSVETCQGDSTWGPCEPEWGYRARITINADGISGAQTLVPVLVPLSAGRIDHYDQIGPGGVDLLFLDADLTTELPFEIEAWDASGDSWVWVGVPQVDPGRDDHFWIYFGNPSASSRENPTAVWDADHVAVYHLAEDAGGTGNGALYLDSTGHGHHGDDEVASSAKAGLAGPGQAFDEGDRIVVADHADLTPAELTVEMSVYTQPLTWAFRTLFTLIDSTPEDDFQIPIPLSAATFNYATAQPAGDDLRFFDADRNSLPYWIEQWVPGGDSIVWVKVTDAGTDTIIMWHGNPGAVAESDAAATLESGGVWATFWSTSVASPNNQTEMDALFGGFAYSGRQGWGPMSTIECRDNCNPHAGGSDENYAFLGEGWVSLDADGVHGFSTNSDDASDVFVDDTSVADFYGGHGMAGNLGDHRGTIDRNAGFYRYLYRFQQGTGGDGYEAGYDLPGGGNNYNILSSSRLFHHKRADPQPVATLARTDLVAIRFVKPGSWSLGSAELTAGGSVNDQVLTSLQTEGWHTLALTYDGADIELFVDGSVATTFGYTQAIATTTNDVIAGDRVGDWYDQSGPVDELRVSRVARSTDWLLLQTRSVSGALVNISAVGQP